MSYFERIRMVRIVRMVRSLADRTFQPRHVAHAPRAAPVAPAARRRAHVGPGRSVGWRWVRFLSGILSVLVRVELRHLLQVIGSFQRTGHINFEVFPKFLVRGVFRSAFEVRCDLPLSFPDVRFSRIAEVMVGHIRRFRSGPVEVWPREERARTPEVAQLASPLALAWQVQQAEAAPVRCNHASRGSVEHAWGGRHVASHRPGAGDRVQHWQHRCRRCVGQTVAF